MQQQWLQVYSWQSFRLARDAAEILLAEDPYPNPESVIQKCAVTCMYTAYCRPFGHNHGAGQLPAEQVVPREYADLHARMFEYRDKAIAHSDNEPDDVVTCAVNQVHLLISGGNRSVSPIIHFPQKHELVRIVEHCAILIRKAEYHMQKFGKKYVSPLHLGDGRYRLNAHAHDDNWLVKLE